MSNKDGEKKQIEHMEKMRKKARESGGVPEKMWRELTKDDGHVPDDVSVEDLNEHAKKKKDALKDMDEILESLDNHKFSGEN